MADPKEKKRRYNQYIYDSLQSIEEKMQFIIDLEAYAAISAEMGDEGYQEDLEISENLKESFLDTYVRKADKNTQDEVFAAIARINAKNCIDMYNDSKALQGLVPENEDKRDKKIYYLNLGCEKGGSILNSINGFSKEINSVFYTNPEIVTARYRDANINEDTTMNQFAQYMGYTTEEEKNEYFGRMGSNKDEKLFDYYGNKLRTNNQNPSPALIKLRIQDELMHGIQANIRLKTQRQFFEAQNMSVEDMQGVQTINRLNSEELSVKSIEDWADHQGAAIIDQRRMINNMQLKTQIEEKYDRFSEPFEEKERVDELNDFSKKCLKVVSLKDLLLAELKEIRGRLALTQENPEANFYDGEKPEGSTEYQAMATSIKNAITALENPDVTLGDVTNHIFNVIDRSSEYHEAKDGILGPQTENGIRRFTISDDTQKRLSGLYAKYQDAYDDYKDTARARNADITLFGEKTIRSIAEDNKAYALNQADGAQLTDMTDSAAEDVMKIRLVEDKKMLFEKLAGKVPFDINNPEGFNPPQTDNVTTAAKNYIAKKFITRAMSPDVTSEELRDMEYSLIGKGFDNQVKKYSNNVMFKDVVKKIPGRVYLTWSDIETESERIKTTAEDKLLDIRPGHETQEHYITHHNIEGKSPRERIIINIAYVLKNKMLAEPSNDALRNGLAADPGKEQTLDAFLKKYAEREIVDKLDMSKDKPIQHALDSKSLNGKLIKGFAEEQKAEQQRRRQNQAQHNIENANEGPHVGPRP